MNSGFTGTKLHVTNTVVQEERLMLNATETGISSSCKGCLT